MQGYCKLFSTIITSSIWSEDDKTRIVWITMLALADKYGNVQASIPGLAATSRVTIQECEAAVRRLSSPDPYSRTKDSEGRRVEAIEGGWHLLNYGKYRRMRRSAERTEYLRIKQREHRERQRQAQHAGPACQQPVNTSTPVNPSQPIAEAEAEAEAEAKKHVLKNNQEEEGRRLRQIFDHWNRFSGRSIEKLDDEGHPQRILWHSHRLKDDSITFDIKAAIRQALVGYFEDDVCAAIDNYATVLFGPEYRWTHVWTLGDFLTVKREARKDSPHKWWQFLPDNFTPAKYMSHPAEGGQGLTTTQDMAPGIADFSGCPPAALDELQKHGYPADWAHGHGPEERAATTAKGTTNAKRRRQRLSDQDYGQLLDPTGADDGQVVPDTPNPVA